MQSKKLLKKRCRSAEKFEVKNTKIAKGGLLVCFRGSGRWFCFRRGSEISSIF